MLVSKYTIHRSRDVLGSGKDGDPLVISRHEPGERAIFAAQFSKVLATNGVWLSLIGSTEGPPREVGPPRRSARDVMNAVEPYLEILSLRSNEFRDISEPAKAWICISRRRDVPAQPSSRHR